jgi:hypothetical protein
MSDRLVSDLLASIAASFLPDQASDTDIAGVLAELLVALRLHDDLSRGVIPPRGTVGRRSPAMAGLETAVATALRQRRAQANQAGSPTVPPARLQVPGPVVAQDFQPRAMSEAEEITLRDAAGMLGLKSSERVRQLVAAGVLNGCQDAYGRRTWRVTRASVITYGKRRSGDYGAGGSGSGRHQQVA